MRGKGGSSSRIPTLARLAWVAALFAVCLSAACATEKTGPEDARVERSPVLVAPGVDVGTELDLGEPTPGRSSYLPFPALAPDGAGTTLVVWSTFSDLLAARLLSDGTTLDPDPIVVGQIDTSSIIQGSVAASPDGDGWLVTWFNRKSGDWDIFGARIDASGNLLDPGGFVIRSAPGEQWYPRVAWGEDGWLVAWTDLSDGNYSAQGTRVNPSGTVLDTPPLVIAANGVGPEVAAGTDSWLVVSSDSSTGEVLARRYSFDAVALDAAPLVVASNPGVPTSTMVAAAGSSWLVAWADVRGANPAQDIEHDIFVARVSQTGAVLDPAGIPLQTGQDYPDPLGVIADASGDGWLVAYEANSKRVSASGVVSSGSLLHDTKAIVFDGTYYLAVWIDGRVNLRRRQQDLVPIDPIEGLGLLGFNQEISPVAAFNGTSWLVCWQDSREMLTTSTIYAARVSTDGALLDPAGIALGGLLENDGDLAVAASGDEWLVVYRSSADVFATRVASDGTRLDTGLTLSTGFSVHEVAVAATSTGWLAVWAEGSLPSRVYGALVGREGSVSPVGGFQIGPENSGMTVSVATDGEDYLVSYSQFGPAQNPLLASPSIIGASRVTRSGQLLDPGGFIVSQADGARAFSDAVPTADGWLVAWEDERPENPGSYGTRVSKDGTVLDPAGVFISSFNVPHLAHDGSEPFVAWAVPGNPQSSLIAARLYPNGVPGDPGGFVAVEPALLSGNLAQAYAFDVAAGPPGSLLFTYSTVVGPYVQVKARIAEVDALPPPPATGGAAGEAGATGSDAGASGDSGVDTGGANQGGGGAARGGRGGAGGTGGASAGGRTSSAGTAGADVSDGGESGAGHGGRPPTGGRGGSGTMSGGAGGSRASVSRDQGGCGCRIAGEPRTGDLAKLWALALVLGAAHRRHRARSTGPRPRETSGAAKSSP